VEEEVFLDGVFDVSLQEERVHFSVDILDSDLESIESAGFRDLNFLHETYTEVFVDDAIGSSEKGEDVGNEVAFIVVEGFPVDEITTKIDFFGCNKIEERDKKRKGGQFEETVERECVDGLIMLKFVRVNRASPKPATAHWHQDVIPVPKQQREHPKMETLQWQLVACGGCALGGHGSGQSAKIGIKDRQTVFTDSSRVYLSGQCEFNRLLRYRRPIVNMPNLFKPHACTPATMPPHAPKV
jgi:hypothetical protein